MALAGVFAVTSCSDNEKQGSRPVVRPVKVLKIEDSGGVKIVEFPGQISAVRKSWKAFEVPGRVIERLVKEGELVTKGQVLARLDPRDYRYAFDSAKAEYEAAVAAEERFSKLVQKNAVSEHELERVRRDLLTASAQWQQAKKSLEDTELVADFDGRVAQLLIDDFTNVVAKENVMMIQDSSQLEIVINVPESAVALPIEGASVAEKVRRTKPEVILSVFPNESYPAVYRESAERPDPATRTYAVKLTFTPPADNRIKPGMTAKVRAYIPASEALKSAGFRVPLQAIVTDGKGRMHIWAVSKDSHTVSKVTVSLGSIIGNTCVVSGELRNGDLIATSGVHHLREGQEVSLWSPSAN